MKETEVTIINTTRSRIPLTGEEIRFIIDTCVKHGLNQTNYSVSIVFVGENKIQNLNKDFRGKDKPTDILSFPMMEKIGGSIQLGDIFICPKVVESDWKKYAQSKKQHYVVLLIHGLLHLFGHDHEDDSDFEEMLSLEKVLYRKVCKRLDIPSKRYDLEV